MFEMETATAVVEGARVTEIGGCFDLIEDIRAFGCHEDAFA